MDIHDATQQYEQNIGLQRDRLAAASLRRGERPRDRKSKDELKNKHMLALLMKDMSTSMNMGGMAGQSTVMIHSSFMPPAYPPSTTPLASLRSIMIRELRLEMHHRGRYIALQSITPATRMTAVMAIMVDEEEAAVTLQLYQQEDEELRPVASIVNEGTFLIVKEPFFKIMGDGEYGVRVDHLSDVVMVEASSELLPSKWRTQSGSRKFSAEQLKEKGNGFMKSGKHWEAIQIYSQALSPPTSPEPEEIIKRNRALAYLKTHQYDAALADTGYPALNSKSSEKALFRAAEALYHLQKFEACVELAQVLNSAYPGLKQGHTVLQLSQTRVKELTAGVYDFAKLQKLAKQLRPPHFDLATYIGPIEIKASRGKGRGVFLTEAVKAGDLLLCEKAFCHAHVDDKSNMTMLMHPEANRAVMGGQADLIKQIAQKLQGNPSLAEKFTSLHHGKYTRVAETEVDGRPVVDTFLIDTIVSLNAFGSPVSSRESHKRLLENTVKQDQSFHSTGLWITASYINHSCNSNARRSFIGDMMIVRATRDLPAGTEITHWYCSPMDNDFKKCEQKLAHWGFVCDCAICDNLRGTDGSVVQKRTLLVGKIKNLLSSSRGTSTTRKIEVLIGALEQTYTHPAVVVPRTAVWEFQSALASGYHKDKDVKKSLEWTAKALTSLGFVMEGMDELSNDFTVLKWGLTSDYLVHSFMQAKQAFDVLGLWFKAHKAYEYAKTTFRVLVGEDASFSQVYG